ncbi:MAG: hypothetical protein WKF77_25040 [Planctomycetaceae bacterium]
MVAASCTCGVAAGIRIPATSASKSQGEDLDPNGSSRIFSQSRTLQIIARTGAAPDHPVISTCMETDYLKAVWMIVN